MQIVGRTRDKGKGRGVARELGKGVRHEYIYLASKRFQALSPTTLRSKVPTSTEVTGSSHDESPFLNRSKQGCSFP